VDNGKYPCPPQRLTQIQQVLERILTWDAPADAVLARWLREHPKLGARDRAQVADAVFDVLRHLRRYQHYSKHYGEPGSQPTSPQTRRLALLGLASSLPTYTLPTGATQQETQWLRHIQTIQHIPPADLPPAIRLSVPDWLYDCLQTRPHTDNNHNPNTANTHALLAALNQPAPLDVRINPLKTASNAALLSLRQAMLATLRERLPASAPQPTPHSPWGIRLQGRPNIQRLDVFLKGELEIQDEASQLVCALLAPKRGETIIDWCAGAGGKTLLLGALMRNTGRLYAFDTSATRLGKAAPRIARSGLTNIVPGVIESESGTDPRLRRLHGKAHRVLVDAPCSGLGTLRRSPELKWRQNPQILAQLRQTQANVLKQAAACVMPGGRLVYATCSILEEENEAQIHAFLKAHPEFSLQHAGQILQKRFGIILPDPLPDSLSDATADNAANMTQNPAQHPGPFLNLRPHIHHTDGFFAAVLERLCK